MLWKHRDTIACCSSPTQPSVQCKGPENVILLGSSGSGGTWATPIVLSAKKAGPSSAWGPWGLHLARFREQGDARNQTQDRNIQACALDTVLPPCPCIYKLNISLLFLGNSRSVWVQENHRSKESTGTCQTAVRVAHQQKDANRFERSTATYCRAHPQERPNQRDSCLPVHKGQRPCPGVFPPKQAKAYIATRQLLTYITPWHWGKTDSDISTLRRQKELC